MQHSQYIVIWEFLVKEEYISQFKAFYGPKGDWVELFKKGQGYLKTELYQDKSNPSRFLTADHWQSEQLYKDFRQQYSQEYEQLDKQCEHLTNNEQMLGEFSL